MLIAITIIKIEAMNYVNLNLKNKKGEIICT